MRFESNRVYPITRCLRSKWTPRSVIRSDPNRGTLVFVSRKIKGTGFRGDTLVVERERERETFQKKSEAED